LALVNGPAIDGRTPPRHRCAARSARCSISLPEEHEHSAASTSNTGGKATVEVKIGVRNATRELVLESAQSPKEVEKAVFDALGGKSDVLDLTDERGRRVIVVTAHLTYVEIGEPIERRVGFGAV
jgi:Protein of unknown function (DUF3107)